MNNGGQARLTWDATLSRPYESAWSTFVRVCTINAMTPVELARLISRESRYPSTLRKFWTSEWVDFERYSALLGVTASSLRAGFLDQIGFPHPGRQEYAIRHCRRCWHDGYHCALFDLSIIRSCPWHGVELSPPCICCAATMPYQVKDMKAKRDVVCPSCGLRYHRLRDIIYRRSAPERMDEVRRKCDSLVSWKKGCDNRLSEGLEMLGSVGAPDCAEAIDAIEWQLGLAEKLASTETPWEWAIRPESIHVAIVEGGCRHDSHASIGVDDHHDLLCKALRRIIYKRHVRPHRACLRQLSQLSHSRLPALKGNVCSTALAYLVWHMRMKQSCNIDSLRVPTKNRLPPRIEMPSVDLLGEDAALVLLYAEFFALWFELDSRCGRENFDINLFDDVRYRYAQFFSIQKFASKEPLSALGKHLFLIAHPDPKTLMASAAARCRARKAASESMTNPSYTEHVDRWCWSSKTGRYQRRMFHIRDTHLLKNGVATPLLV